MKQSIHRTLRALNTNDDPGIQPAGQYTPALLKDSTDSLLTRQEAARLLSVTVNTIDKWGSAGDFNVYRHRGEVRYLKSEIIGVWKVMNNDDLKNKMVV